MNGVVFPGVYAVEFELAAAGEHLEMQIAGQGAKFLVHPSTAVASDAHQIIDAPLRSRRNTYSQRCVDALDE